MDQINIYQEIKIGNKEVKLFLFTDMSLYIEEPKDSTKRLLELLREFGKVTGCKNKQQTNKKQLEINQGLKYAPRNQQTISEKQKKHPPKYKYW